MKFTDGYWQNLPGVSILKAADIDELVDTGDRLIAYCPTTKVRGRGDTLNRPLVTVTYDTPAPDVIGVRIEHHQGIRPKDPSFAIHRTDVQPTITIEGAVGAGERISCLGMIEGASGSGASGSLTSGDLTVLLSAEGGFSASFVAGDAVLTTSLPNSIGVITDADGRHFVREQLSLGVGEHVYGLGERFGPLVKNGQSVDLWNADGGTASDQAYKNVPFHLTDGGYGVFVAHPDRVGYEVATEVVGRTQFSVEGHHLQYYVIYGPTPKDILRKYTALTGRPAEVPDWSYGLWLSTSFTTSYDEGTVTAVIDGMAERDLPLSVFHFDSFWMRQFHWCDFVWDPATFPEPAAMLERLRAKGVKISVWMNPYIAQRSALFAEGRDLGYLLTTDSGDVWQTDLWQAGMGLVDFSNPDARDWFTSKLKVLLDQGVDSFKTDFGERIPSEGVRWHDGSDPARMHNYYAQAYNQAVFDLLKAERGEGQAVLFARSATAGGQQLPIHWGGDCESTYSSMAESLRGGLSLALSGFGYWSHDIGGFEGTPDAGVFKRWLAFGLLSSHSRLHGSGSSRAPWLFDEEAVDVTRSFTRLKLSLMPYLAGLGRQAHSEGTPILRPMVLEFPYDRSAVTLDTQYMLGDQLLVAPVFTPDGVVDFYLPAGEWTHLLSGETLHGPAWHRQTYDFDSLPLFVRPGSVLARGACTDRPDYDHLDGVTLDVYAFADGDTSTITVASHTGSDTVARFTVERSGDQFTVTAAGTTQRWHVSVIGTDLTATATGATTVTLG